MNYVIHVMIDQGQKEQDRNQRPGITSNAPS